MSILGLALFFLGFFLAIIGSLWTIVLAFMEHVGWGFASLLIPFAAFAFVIVKWSKKSVRRSFLLQILGLLLGLLGGGIAVSSGALSVANKPAPIAPLPESSSDFSPSPSPSPSTFVASPERADDPFRDAVNKAMSAAQLTQTAKTKTQWATVTTTWQEAINLMKAVPADNPNFAQAQQKVREYQNNLAYAKKNAQSTKAGS